MSLLDHLLRRRQELGDPVDSSNSTDLSDPAAPDYHQREIEPAYIEPEQQKMLDAIGQYDILGCLDAVVEAEKNKAPRPLVSRILSNESSVREFSLFTVAQPANDVIRSVLDNTLPQRALGGLQIRQPSPLATWHNTPDPVIYLNYLADKNGQGLSCVEFEQFLEAYEMAARLEPLTDDFDVNGVSLRKGIDAEFSKNRSKAARFFDQLSNETTMKTAVQGIVAANRSYVLPAARRQNIDHIMFKAEVGWSYKGYERCGQHARLDITSPDAFRLAQLVARHLHPTRGFRLHQFILLDIVQANQAAIGESIASQLCASYIAYGGFNVEQAGISATGAWQGSSEDWRKVQDKAAQKYLKHVNDNMSKARELYNQRRADAEEEKNVLRLQEELKRVKQRSKLAEERLATDVELANHETQQTVHQLEGLRGEVRRETEKQNDLNDANAALARFAEQLEVRVPSSMPDGS